MESKLHPGRREQKRVHIHVAAGQSCRSSSVRGKDRYHRPDFPSGAFTAKIEFAAPQGRASGFIFIGFLEC
jgi:hypothetical protein